MVSFKHASAILLWVSCFLVANAQNTLVSSGENCPITQVCFVIDQSGSIDDGEYVQEQMFVNEIAKLIKSVTATAELSAVAFANAAQVIQDPTADINTFTSSVNNPRLFRGSTAISLGLSTCFSPLQGLTGIRIIVLVTDGAPNSQAATTAVADQIRAENGVFLVTVGIGLSGTAEQFLMSIAEKPEFAIISDFNDLQNVVTDVVTSICTVVDISPSPDPMDECEKAYDLCSLQFKGETKLTKYDILPNQPDKAFTPVIVPKDPTMRVAVLNTNNIVPEFIDANGATPITDFGSQAFTPTHFKPFWINSDSGSGIGHQTFHGNQAMVAKDKCVRVYFTSFQVLENVNGNLIVVDNRNDVPRSENKCVVFET